MSVRRDVSEPQARDCEDTASHHLSNVSDWHYFPSGNEIVGFNGPPGFLTESFSEMLGSYILPESNQVITPIYPSDSAISNEHQVCGTDKHKTKKSMEDYSALVPNSFSIKRAVAEGDVDVLPDVVKTMMVKAEKKERGKVKVSASSSQSLDAKDAQSPARAKRGQATSSHSLAERVRRERISERMKLLQDLVPGCNKITGKAVMLDEIINYVQALQRQVEFLAMKLAAVRPEINVDLEQIIQSQYGNLVIPVYSSGIHISQACSTHRVMQAGMPYSVTPNPDVLLRAASSELSAMNQTHTLSDYDLQHILQLGSMSNQHQESIKIDDTMKVEP